jgi:glycosyltransferase involved in cell wall biosynthesis
MMIGRDQQHLTGRELVTVVVPAYNAAWSIGRTLASVCAQSYSNLEILVIDDGSTDATSAVVRLFEARDNRVRLIRQRNSGVAAARNTGVRSGRGVYVAPIDSDDLWAPTNIERQVAALSAQQRKSSISFAAFCYIDVHDWVLGHVGPGAPSPPRLDFEGLYRLNSIGNGSGAVMLRSRVLEVGGYDENLRAHSAQGAEDWKLALRLAEHYPATFVPKVLVGYRQSDGCMSMSPSMFRACLYMLQEVSQQNADLSLEARRAAKANILIHFLWRYWAVGNWITAASVGSHLIRDLSWALGDDARAIVRHGILSIARGRAKWPDPSAPVKEILFEGRDIFDEYKLELEPPKA